MTVFSLAPGFVIVFYTSNGHPHKHIIPVRDPQQTGGVWEVRRSDATFEPIATSMTNWANAVKALFQTASTLQYWELWTKADENADPVFRATGTLNVVGTTTGTAIANGQILFSYRTSVGNTGKVQFMEHVAITAVKSSAPYSGAVSTFVTYLLGDTAIYVGRDGGRPINVPFVFTKTNDFLRKKYVINA